MQIALTALGNVSETAPKTFFRVETWNTGRRVADFTTEVEALNAAKASNHSGRFDHKVARIVMRGR